MDSPSMPNHDSLFKLVKSVDDMAAIAAKAESNIRLIQRSQLASIERSSQMLAQWQTLDAQIITSISQFVNSAALDQIQARIDAALRINLRSFQETIDVAMRKMVNLSAVNASFENQIQASLLRAGLNRESSLSDIVARYEYLSAETRIDQDESVSPSDFSIQSAPVFSKLRSLLNVPNLTDEQLYNLAWLAAIIWYAASTFRSEGQLSEDLHTASLGLMGYLVGLGLQRGR